MADDLTGGPSTSEEPPSVPQEQSGAGQARPVSWEAPLRRRFGLAYLALAAVVGAAVGLFIVFVGRQDAPEEVAWSRCRPAQHGLAAATEIAERCVQNRYRLASGNALVGVIVRPPVLQTQGQSVQVSSIAVRSGFPDERARDIRFFDGRSTIFYYLCGLGEQCAIPEGKPSVARGQLLRREGLELALYTFKYVEGVDSVVAFIPPPPGDDPQALLFFNRSDLAAQLTRPLGVTLPHRNVLVPGKLTEVEEGTISALTRERVYRYTYQQIPDGTAILVLAPLQA